MALKFVKQIPDRKVRARTSLLTEAIAELKKNPGQWAELKKFKGNAQAYSLKTKAQDKGLEAEVREGAVYARWPAK